MAALGSKPEVRQTQWINAHDSAAGGVDRHQIAAHYQHAALFRRSLDGPVALHPDNPIHNRKAARKYTMQLGDRTIDTDLVKLVFRPPVDRSGDQAEEVFHGQSRASP